MNIKKKYVCVFVSLLILFAALSCRTPAGRAPGQVVDDSAITTEVKAKFLADGVLKGLAISVSTFEGIVTLTGAVKDQGQKNKATEVAKMVKGVKKINNLLEIKPL
jgi:hyperosmotically inducible periplasmic protein